MRVLVDITIVENYCLLSYIILFFAITVTSNPEIDTTSFLHTAANESAAPNAPSATVIVFVPVVAASRT